MQFYYGFFAIYGTILIASCFSRQKRQNEDTPLVFPEVENIPENSCKLGDGSDGVCRPAGLCVFRLDSNKDSSHQPSCDLNADETGLCCPKKPSPTRVLGAILPDFANPSVNMPDISLNELDSAGEEGLSMVEQMDYLEGELKRKGLFVRKDSKEYFHQALLKSDHKQLQKIGRDGLIGVEATLKLVRTFHLDTVQSRDGLRRFSLTNTVIRNTCPKVPPCPPTKYRTIDGSCNNLDNPSWGKSFTAFTRFLPPRYNDGINEPRLSYDGGPLPSVREVSSRICPDADKSSSKFTALFAQWGEFLAHDLSHTSITTAENGEGILCCHPEIQRNQRLLHPSCLPVYIPSNDPFYSKFNTSCMEFVRSRPAARPDCSFGAREQLNMVTSFIDGSMIYGSSENETNALRTFSGGMLNFSLINGVSMLPVDSEDKVPCMRNDRKRQCFKAGDSRVNEQPLLVLMHTLWQREHNRISTALSKQNRGWKDEILFRESKRLLTAEIQHITYSEYLPLLLGEKVMSSFKLSPKLAGHSFDYDSNLNPGIINAFSAAAFRMGHTLVQGTMQLYRTTSDTSESVPLNSQFFNPTVFYLNGSLSRLFKGITRRASQRFDKFVSSHLTNHLFELEDEPFGLDLVALDIQRGRDHGLAGYNEWREHCGLSRIRNFEELSTVMDPTSAGNFSRLYRNVDDIDLFPAGISENHLPDAVMGPTLSCIVAEQFRRLKQGDRFWYENGGLESSFTEEQLIEIRKSTMARIICDNIDFEETQLVAFLKSAKWNPIVSCKTDKIPKPNLSFWRNEPVWT